MFLQRYPNLEYVWMDGGSKDNTVEVLKPYIDRFAYFVSERDKGQSDAIRRGFERSTGEIMSYLNSDDMLAPGALWLNRRGTAFDPASRDTRSGNMPRFAVEEIVDDDEILGATVGDVVDVGA